MSWKIMCAQILKKCELIFYSKVAFEWNWNFPWRKMLPKNWTGNWLRLYFGAHEWSFFESKHVRGTLSLFYRWRHQSDHIKVFWVPLHAFTRRLTFLYVRFVFFVHRCGAHGFFYYSVFLRSKRVRYIANRPTQTVWIFFIVQRNVSSKSSNIDSVSSVFLLYSGFFLLSRAIRALLTTNSIYNLLTPPISVGHLYAVKSFIRTYFYMFFTRPMI